MEREDRTEKTATKATVTAAASAAVLAGRSSGSSMGALPAMTHTAIASLAEAVVRVREAEKVVEQGSRPTPSAEAAVRVPSERIWG